MAASGSAKGRVQGDVTGGRKMGESAGMSAAGTCCALTVKSRVWQHAGKSAAPLLTVYMRSIFFTLQQCSKQASMHPTGVN